jgi:hypothetical protein
VPVAVRPRFVPGGVGGGVTAEVVSAVVPRVVSGVLVVVPAGVAKSVVVVSGGLEVAGIVGVDSGADGGVVPEFGCAGLPSSEGCGAEGARSVPGVGTEGAVPGVVGFGPTGGGSPAGGASGGITVFPVGLPGPPMAPTSNGAGPGDSVGGVSANGVPVDGVEASVGMPLTALSALLMSGRADESSAAAVPLIAMAVPVTTAAPARVRRARTGSEPRSAVVS